MSRVAFFLALALAAPLLSQAQEENTEAQSAAPGTFRWGVLEARLKGRLMLDSALFEGTDGDTSVRSEVRRARLIAQGRLLNDWRLLWQHEFSGEHPRVVEASVTYAGFRRTRIKFGQFQEPLGLDELTSSTALLFMERSQSNLFAPGYNQGVALSTHAERWTFHAGLFAPHAGEITQLRDEERGITGRATYSPQLGSGTRLHLGWGASRRDVAPDARVRFEPDEEARLADLDRVRTGSLRQVDEYLVTTMEAALQYDRWLLQGEYARARLHFRDSGADTAFHGWYVVLSYVLSGEARDYQSRRGTFGAPGKSAVELALRYSMVDLDDAPARGGRQRNLTVGINWTLDANWIFMANLIHSESARRGVERSDGIIQARIHFAYP